MKTSNKLVILILLIFFGSIFGSAMILKQEFQKIDFDDPFYGLVRNDLPAFSAVKLKGKPWGRMDIRIGEHFEFLHPNQSDIFQYEVRSDTLFLNYTPDTRNRFKSTAYILAPRLASVHSEGFSCRLHAWQGDSLQLSYAGENGFLVLTDNQLNKISVSLSNGGTFKLEEGNQLGKASIALMDSSNLVIETTSVDSLQLKASPQATVQLPGALLEKIKR